MIILLFFRNPRSLSIPEASQSIDGAFLKEVTEEIIQDPQIGNEE